MPTPEPLIHQSVHDAARDALRTKSTGWLLSFSHDDTPRYIGFEERCLLDANDRLENVRRDYPDAKLEELTSPDWVRLTQDATYRSESARLSFRRLSDDSFAERLRLAERDRDDVRLLHVSVHQQDVRRRLFRHGVPVVYTVRVGNMQVYVASDETSFLDLLRELAAANDQLLDDYAASVPLEAHRLSADKRVESVELHAFAETTVRLTEKPTEND